MLDEDGFSTFVAVDALDPVLESRVIVIPVEGCDFGAGREIVDLPGQIVLLLMPRSQRPVETILPSVAKVDRYAAARRRGEIPAAA